MDNNKMLAEYIIAMGDDELILGHRDSEWCGHAPILEEDIAFANIAIDEIGHAQSWYKIAANLLGESEEKYPDMLAFERPSKLWRALELVSMPKGDWAFTIIRQFIMDSFELEKLNKLVESKNRLVSELAAKIRNEEMYHYRHSSEWVKRLGLGTEISNQKMQAGLNQLWKFVPQLNEEFNWEKELVEMEWIPKSNEVYNSALIKITDFLQNAELDIPKLTTSSYSRKEQPQNMHKLLEEMQEVPRTFGQHVKW